MPSTNNGDVVLEVRNLKKAFELPLGLIQVAMRRKPDVVTAVDDVSFQMSRGEILGLVGESGCGKTTLLRCIVRIYEADSGEVLFEGRNLLQMAGSALRQERRDIQVIFQDPYASLNPRMTVGQVLQEILAVHKIRPPEEIDARKVELLELVGLGPDALRRLPAQFSGGQRQRVGLARALAMEPTLLLADEPVSSLDVSIQAQVINLLVDLQTKLHLTMLFVTHDLRVVRHISHRIAVMYLGKIMEIGPTERIFSNPIHPYTRALLAAAPELDPTVRKEIPAVQGDPPNPIHIPPGCRFHPRCGLAGDSCKLEIPELIEVEPRHWAACSATTSEAFQYVSAHS